MINRHELKKRALWAGYSDDIEERLMSAATKGRDYIFLFPPMWDETLEYLLATELYSTVRMRDNSLFVYWGEMNNVFQHSLNEKPIDNSYLLLDVLDGEKVSIDLGEASNVTIVTSMGEWVDMGPGIITFFS